MDVNWLIGVILLTVALVAHAQDKPIPMDLLVKDGQILVDGDMYLTPEQYAMLYEPKSLQKDTEGAFKRATAVRGEKYRWPKAELPFMINDDFNYKDKYWIARAMTEWERNTCIRFRPKRDDDKDFIHLQNGYGGCNAQLGNKNGKQNVNLEAPGCRYKGLYLHELGHAMGLIHEQQRPDRDQYIWIDEDNVEPSMREWFRPYEPDFVDTMGVRYEYSSIMHYGITAFSPDKKQTIHAKDESREKEIGKVYLKELAYVDVEIVNKMYKCAAHCPNQNRCGQDGHLDENCNCVCRDGSKDCDPDKKIRVKKSCINTYSNSFQCYIWANQGECGRNTNFMTASCAKACHFCGPKPVQPSACKDVHKEVKCQTWAERGDCLTNKDWMTLNCPKSCNLCRGQKKPQVKDCDDAKPICEVWARNGECQVNPRYMSSYCSKSCETCSDGPKTTAKPDDPNCRDSDRQCKHWADGGQCKKNPLFMLPTCKKSCDQCNVTEKPYVCKDSNPKCRMWSGKGECLNNPKWMLKNCKKSCQQC